MTNIYDIPLHMLSRFVELLLCPKDKARVRIALSGAQLLPKNTLKKELNDIYIHHVLPDVTSSFGSYMNFLRNTSDRKIIAISTLFLPSNDRLFSTKKEENAKLMCLFFEKCNALGLRGTKNTFAKYSLFSVDKDTQDEINSKYDTFLKPEA